MTLTVYNCEADLEGLGRDDEVVEAAEVVPVDTEQESGRLQVSGRIVYYHAYCWDHAMPNVEVRRRGRLGDLFPAAFP
jgi:hypothetical protein